MSNNRVKINNFF